MIPVVDLHTCIQGEGKYAGTPSILIRMSGCNLNCQFKDDICDSSHASWNAEAGNFTMEDISNILDSHPGIHHVFITGGNPTFQPRLLQEIVDLCKEKGKFVAIEDNGTLYRAIKGLDFVTISPKMSNSDPIPGSRPERLGRIVKESDLNKHRHTRMRWDSILYWINAYDYQLKFVISDQQSINEALEMLSFLGCDLDNVYFMPEGTTREQLASRRVWLIEQCIRLGIKYTDRLHIIAYNDERGV